MSPIDIVESYLCCASSVPKEIFAIFNKVQECVDSHEFYRPQTELIVFGAFLDELEDDLSEAEFVELNDAWEGVLEEIVEGD